MATIKKTYVLNGITVNEIDQDEDIASDELKQYRLNICNTCEKKQGEGCTECSCLLVNRTAFTESFCPIGKW